jgi:Fe-S cluster biogenesis protein NfuA
MKIAASDTILEFTKENVDLVLNEIRPYLIADGGNVAVAEIDVNKYSVSLILEGACGSCPSSTTTMKMGIERGIIIIIIIIIILIIISTKRKFSKFN